MNRIFSLLIPTRRRIDQVERMLGTIVDMTDVHDRLEILFMSDEDDPVTQAYLRRVRKRFPIHIRVFVRVRHEFLNHAYYNRLSREAVGEFQWVIGDDLLFVKKGWDTFLIDKINEFLKEKKTKVLYVSIKDDVDRPPGAPPYANFPLISKRAVAQVGYLMPPSIPSWSGDYLVYLIYAHPRVERVLEIKELILSHPTTNQITMRDCDGVTNLQRNIYTKYDVPNRVKEYETNELPVVIGRLAESMDSTRKEPYIELK